MGIIRDLKRWRFWRRFFTHALSALGLFALAAGLVDVFFPGSLANLAWLAFVGLLIAVLYGLSRAWPRPVQVVFSAPQTRISLVRGDLFDQETHLAIGVCDTFDTAPPIIARTSVQWAFSDRIFGGDVAALDATIEQALVGSTPAGEIEKTGKTVYYDIGTVATLSLGARRHFLVAYSSMDATNKAHSTPDELWKSLANLWVEVRLRSNGEPVSVPVFGGGQSGLSRVLPAEDAIRFTALSFIVASRTTKVCDELRIVARPELYDRLDHLELQAFLSGLSRA